MRRQPRWRIVADARWPARTGSAYAARAARRRQHGGGRLGLVCDYHALAEDYARCIWHRGGRRP